MRTDHLDRAAPLFLEAARICDGIGEPRVQRMLVAYVEAELFERAAGLKWALPRFARCLEAARAAFGPDHFVTGHFTMVYAQKLLEVKRPAEAVEQYRESLRIFRGLHAPGQAIGGVVLGVGRAVRDRGREGDKLEAERIIREAMGILRDSRPTNSVRSLLSQSCLIVGLLASRRGEPGDEPLGLVLESLKIRRELFGPDAIIIGETLDYLAECYIRAGRPDEAIRSYEEALAIARRHPGLASPWRQHAEENLARLRAR